jgi:2-methylisocitrate lyase-like PEP mutase family enzyme
MISLSVLGAPDKIVLTLFELTEQIRRMSRACELPLMVDANHGYGNALNVRRITIRGPARSRRIGRVDMHRFLRYKPGKTADR